MTHSPPGTQATIKDGVVEDARSQKRAPGFSRLGKLAAKSGHAKAGAGVEPAQGESAAQQSTSKPRALREGEVANGLLNLEREARRAASESELGYLMVNGSRVAVQYRQAILLMRSGRSRHKVSAVSSLSAVDRNSTFIRWIERLATSRLADSEPGQVISFDVKADGRADDLDAKAYPFHNFALIPLTLRDGTVFAHLMLTREGEWDEPSLVAAARLCETYSHAWEALSGPRKTKRRLRSRALAGLLSVGLIIVAGLYPVPLTVLAPAEVTAANPYVVSSPIDGVIETIAVDPNTFVKHGALLFSYSDTDLRNQVKLAGQAVAVAEARYTQSVRTAFSDARAKRELSIAQSELQLKAAEYDYAKELLDKSEVRASRDGLVIFADKDQWTGRPVSTGERIMRIANPSKVELTVNVPVSDAIVLNDGADVQLYLDSDPLKSIKASLVSASFHATPDEAGTLSYRVQAQFDPDENGTIRPRIGLRGTAQLYGDKVLLAYFLFRKPLSVIRQWTGM